MTEMLAVGIVVHPTMFVESPELVVELVARNLLELLNSTKQSQPQRYADVVNLNISIDVYDRTEPTVIVPWLGEGF